MAEEMMFPKPKRITNRAYLKWVKSLYCSMTNEKCRGPIDPHHVTPRSLGGSDYSAVPLCRFHHDYAHAHPAEAAYHFKSVLLVMAELWKEHKASINTRSIATQRQKIRTRHKRQVLRAYVLVHDSQFSLPVFESIQDAEFWRKKNQTKGRIARCRVELESVK